MADVPGRAAEVAAGCEVDRPEKGDDERMREVYPTTTPAILMIDLAEAAAFHLDRYKPIGSYVQRMPEKKRDILKNLRSEDIADVRWPLR